MFLVFVDQNQEIMDHQKDMLKDPQGQKYGELGRA
jgi:hypothetical protein